MNEVDLLYGHTACKFAFDPARFSLLTNQSQREVQLRDADIGAAFDSPIGSPPIEELVDVGDSALIVVSDATRATASAQIVNLLIRRLIQAGVSLKDLAIIFATGIHRPVTAQEKTALLTPFIAQRVRTIDHDSNNANALIDLGTTASGIPVRVNRALKEFSRIILTGGIGFHYFAGFTGGRKSICPGLASTTTIEATHMLALDFAKGGRKSGVGAGLLDGNAVHEECDRIAEIIAPTFGVSTIVDESKSAVAVFCGHWRGAHRAACDHYLQQRSAEIGAKREVVIASCGGFPYDINLIQAHKALDMAAYACAEGGTIILLAECRDGLGRSDFLKWFGAHDSRSLERNLRAAYEVNGQTAWTLLNKAERFKVILVSSLSEADVRSMRMIPAATLGDAMSYTSANAGGYIMPRGAAVMPRVISP